jgi:hypothetical protein
MYGAHALVVVTESAILATLVPPSVAADLRWWNQPKWLALGAATLGYMLDACDVLLYVFAIQAIRRSFR